MLVVILRIARRNKDYLHENENKIYYSAQLRLMDRKKYDPPARNKNLHQIPKFYDVRPNRSSFFHGRKGKGQKNKRGVNKIA